MEQVRQAPLWLASKLHLAYPRLGSPLATCPSEHMKPEAKNLWRDRVRPKGFDQCDYAHLVKNEDEAQIL